MRRRVLPIYALFLLETLTWIAMIPLAPTYADEFGLTGVETGAILAAASLAALVAALPLGVLADRFGAREVTLASAGLFTLATLGQGLAGDFWSLLVARAGFGLAFGALWGAGASWLSNSLSHERRAGALAAATTVAGLGFTIGPVFAGVVADRFETGTPFVVLAIAAAAVTISLFAVPAVHATDVTTPSLRETLRVVRRDELVLAGIAIIVLIGLVGGGVNLLVPLQLKANGVSAAEIGLLFSAASAVYTVVSAIVARLGERSATLRVGGISALLTGMTIVLVLISPSTLAAIAFVLLRAPPWSTMDTIIYPLAAAGAHRSALGRGSVMGLVMLGWASASTVGPILAGAVADSAGDRAAYGIMIAACALIGLWLLRAGSRTRAPHVPVDLGRLYGAPDLDALRSEYDRIASVYDSGVGDDMAYALPRRRRRGRPEPARARGRRPRRRRRHRPARSGARPRPDFVGSMLSTCPAACSTWPRSKGVYRDLRVATLGETLDYETASYDGVVSAGVLTAGHAPATTLDELVRVTRPGGHVIFTLRSDTALPGFDDKIAELERARRWTLVDRGDEFQALPRGEPEVLVRVWAFRVLEPEPA